MKTSYHAVKDSTCIICIVGLTYNFEPRKVMHLLTLKLYFLYIWGGCTKIGGHLGVPLQFSTTLPPKINKYQKNVLECDVLGLKWVHWNTKEICSVSALILVLLDNFWQYVSHIPLKLINLLLNILIFWYYSRKCVFHTIRKALPHVIHVENNVSIIGYFWVKKLVWIQKNTHFLLTRAQGARKLAYGALKLDQWGVF